MFSTFNTKLKSIVPIETIEYVEYNTSVGI